MPQALTSDGVFTTTVGPMYCEWGLGGFHKVCFQDAPFSEGESVLFFQNNDQALWIEKLKTFLNGQGPWPKLPYTLPQATPLQHQVWRALTTIPAGQVRTYGEVAAMIGYGNAIRAVAQACAANPCAIIVPCHRVVPRAGGVGGYRWGVARKQALLTLEGACL
jgi:AraC family transcriptional regulator of adaptative response/methylated-DNA-[protein]-cysteine methyltransferase